MIARAIVGVVLCLVGALWIAQGLDVVKGSAMTGHGIWAVLGTIVVVAGLALIAAGARRSRS
ncbi:MAG TPA: hypothetical protein VH479_13780 [Acidimicrobiales bacterium]